MAGRLTGTVVLRSPDTGLPAAFHAGDELPAWAAKLVTNPDLLEQDEAPELPDGDPDETWKVPQLRAWATAHDVDLDGARAKGDILDAIAAATGSTDDEDESEADTGDDEE